MDKLNGYRALEPLSDTVCLHLDPEFLAPRTERKNIQLVTGHLSYGVLSQ